MLDSYCRWNHNKITFFFCHYIHNCSTVDRGMLGCIDVNWHKEESPKIWQSPHGAPCIFKHSLINSSTHSFPKFSLVPYVTLSKNFLLHVLFEVYTVVHSQQTNIHAPCGIRTHNPSRWVTADLCLRLQGHWDQH